MDRYPEIKVEERECSSHRTSASPSASTTPPISSKLTRMHQNDKNHFQQQSCKKGKTSIAPPPQYTSFPTPNYQPHARNDSVHNTTQPISPDSLEAQLLYYAHAPPPYEERQYEGKTEDEQARMRIVSYAREVSRIMGRQLAKGIKGGEKK